MEKLCTKGSVQKEDTLFKCNLYLRTYRGYLSQVFWMTQTLPLVQTLRKEEQKNFQFSLKDLFRCAELDEVTR